MTKHVNPESLMAGRPKLQAIVDRVGALPQVSPSNHIRYLFLHAAFLCAGACVLRDRGEEAAADGPGVPSLCEALGGRRRWRKSALWRL